MADIDIVFILVEPQVPENIGASARAMKTMGFRELRLVNPCNHLDVRSLGVAHLSKEIVLNASIVATLREAIADCDFVIATTAKRRRIRSDYYECSEIPHLIEAKGETVRRVGLVFGREKYGLTNTEVSMCDITSGIRQHARQPSLNLSHAVMLYAYHLSAFGGASCKRSPLEPAPQGEFRALQARVSALLSRIGVPAADGFHRRVIERLAALGKEDVHILHSLSSRVKTALDDAQR